ncbi:hypothetical protein EDB80DRAFT_680243 [Ilyonectria destructans]|nr:hypothetical protein EDB80DRAFT_680243 [Ilyonectria destructans]
MAQSSQEPMEPPPRPSKAGSPRTLGSSRAAPGPFRFGGEQPRGDGRGLTASAWELDCTCANEGAAAQVPVIAEGEKRNHGSHRNPAPPRMAQFIGDRLGSRPVQQNVGPTSLHLWWDCAFLFLLCQVLAAFLSCLLACGGNKASYLPKGGSKFFVGWIQHHCPSPFTSKWHHRELAPVPICTNHVPQDFPLSSPRAHLALTYSVVDFCPASGTRTEMSSVDLARPHSPRNGT